MYVRVSLCAFASVYEMKLFIDSNMKGCLHDELWYFVPIVYNFREAGYPWYYGLSLISLKLCERDMCKRNSLSLSWSSKNNIISNIY